MNKKSYIQPATELLLTAPQSIICVSIEGGGSTSGMGGEVMVRRFNGDNNQLR